ncbi:hypothetical protein TNCV_4128761 [Trichonephila clavipes]|nr:hypothetical protein TNCV_4128761 [Trichonephila clavipes]
MFQILLWSRRKRKKGIRTAADRVQSVTRGLLATDLVILNHGQAMRATPELAPPSPNSQKPMGGRLSSRQL